MSIGDDQLLTKHNIHVLNCLQYKEISLSQQTELLISTPAPEYSFQQVVTNFFRFNEHCYLLFSITSVLKS